MLSLTAFEHLPNHPHQRFVLRRRGDSLFVAQLLCDGFRCAMGPLFDLHIDSETSRKGLLEADSHPQADDGRQRTMCDGRRDQNGDHAEAGCSGQGPDMDVRQVDDRKGAQSQGMLRVCDRGDEVCGQGRQRGSMRQIKPILRKRSPR